VPRSPLEAAGSSALRHALRRSVVVVLAGSTLAAGCSVGNGGLSGREVLAQLDPTSAIPFDDDVHRTVLDNGLTVLVRENDAPGEQAQLRLVVDAGSVLEDPDQAGVAHFLEHMLFNGTERFPGNELTAQLEELGVAFGPDVNAFTTYDETVYSLEVPATDRLLETGLDVLVEWADRATIAADDVEAERGVVLEELRQRDLGIEGRVAHVVQDLVLGGTEYADHPVIGTAEAIASVDAATIRRFYEDWYRPDLMTVIAVGDFDADEVEDMIEERFGALVGPDSPRPRPLVTAGVAGGVAASVLVEPDLPSAYAEVVLPARVPVAETVAQLDVRVATELAELVLEQRLRDDATRGLTPFSSATASTVPMVRGLQAHTFHVAAEPADLLDAVRAVLEEIERIERFGVTTAELDLARSGWAAGLEQRYASRGETQDIEHADGLVAYALTGEPFPDAHVSHDTMLAVLETMTTEDVDAAFVSLLALAPPLLLVVGPEVDAAALPDEAALLAVVAEVDAATIAPREDAGPASGELLAPPDPVDVADDELAGALAGAPVYELRFDNGVRVRTIETGVTGDRVVLEASSPGGVSLAEPDEVLAQYAAPQIVPSSGFGAYDGVALGQLLSDRVVELQPWVDVAREGFYGSASTDDLEVLFQLIHLAMTEPRTDQVALDAWRAEFRPFLADPSSVPDYAVTVALADALFGTDPWYGGSVPLGELDALTVADVDAGYRARFLDADGFTFVFSGDVDRDTIEDLSRRYLGTLPSSGDAPSFVDRRPELEPQTEPVTIEAGTDEQAIVALQVVAPIDEIDIEAEERADLLATILQARLRDHLREELGATYTPEISVVIQDWPSPEVFTSIWIRCDPDRVDEVGDELLADLAALVEDGPEQAELTAARAQLTSDLDYYSDEGLAATLLLYAQHPERDLDDEDDRVAAVRDTDRERLRLFARTALDLDHAALVRQVPDG
jgi:zinc protease